MYIKIIITYISPNIKDSFVDVMCTEGMCHSCKLGSLVDTKERSIHIMQLS